MYPVIVVVISVLLATIATEVAGRHWDLARAYQSRAKYMQMTALAENVESYSLETGTLPASIAALSAAQGFEQTRSVVDNWQGYAVSPVLNDGVWQFQRAVLFSNDPSKGVDGATYLATNACGTGGYDTALGWCGASTSRWYRKETRERYNMDIMTQRARMSRVLQKLADFYNTNAKFPDKDASNNPLATGSINALRTLAGYGGTANTCTGTFTYMGVPVDCGDMFDLWGGPVGYQFISNKHIVLVSESPIFNSSGNRVAVGADFDNSLL